MAESYEKLLDLNRAYVSEEKQAGQTSDRLLVLTWPNIPNAQANLAATWERANRVSLSDFKTEYKTYDGTWRSVDVETTRNSSSGANVVHRFAFGYAETLIWTEARLMTGKYSASNDQAVPATALTTSNNPNRQHVVRFPNLNPNKLDAIAASHNSTETDPVVAGETLSGTWNVIMAIQGRAEDGSGWVDLVLSLEQFTLQIYDKYNSYEQATGYRVYGVPKPLADDILTNWKSKGRDATADYNSDQSLVILTLRDCDAVEDSDIDTSRQVTAFQNRSSFTDRNQTNQITHKTSQTAGKVIETKNHETPCGKHDHETTTTEAVPVSDAVETETLNTFETEVSVLDRNQVSPATHPGEEAGKIVVTKADLNDFAQWDNETRTKESIEVEDAVVSTTYSTFETTTRDTIRNTDTERTVTGETGSIKTHTVEKSEFPDRFHDTIESRDAEAVPGDGETRNAEFAREIQKYETTERTVERNQADEITHQETQEDGKVIRTTNKVNDYGLNDHETLEREAHGVADAVTEKSVTLFEDQESVTDRNQDAAVEAVTVLTPGTLTQTRAEVNEFNRFDNITRTRIAVEAQDVVKEKTVRKFDSEEATTHRNEAAAVTPVDVLVAGTITSTRSEENEFGVFENTTRERSALQSEAGAGIESVRMVEKQAFEHVERETSRNNTDAITEEVSQTSGQVVRTENEVNDFGLNDHSETTRTAQAQAEAGESHEENEFVHTDGTEARNQDAAEDSVALSGGTITSVESRMNEFLKWDVRKTERTAQAVASTQTGHERTAFVHTDESGARNQDSDQSAVSLSGGKITRVQSDKNEYGKWDTTKSEATAQPQDTGWIEFLTRHGTAYVRKWYNQAIGFGDGIASGFTSSTDNSIGTSINAFNLEDGTASKSPYRDSGGESDATPLGWEEIPMRATRIRENPDTGYTEYMYLDYTEYSICEDTYANAIYSLQTKAETVEFRETNIFRVGLRNGGSIWKAVGVTPGIPTGDWVEA